VLRLANQRRRDVSTREPSPSGLGPDPAACTGELMLDERLNRAAQSHSMNMARDDFADHVGKDGSSVATRISVAGFVAADTGEIISYGRSTPAEAIRSWMESTHGHRGNLLNCQWTHTGIGVYYRADDPGQHRYRYYWTMVFARPRS
jgi:serralysin